MLKKKKFKPVITRVKLNPEQAVLACQCYLGFYSQTGSTTETGTYCIQWTKNTVSQTCASRPDTVPS